MIPSDPEQMERAKLTTLGMTQFENLHAPVRASDGELIHCDECQEDWPCSRMGVMLVSQSIMMLQQMLPNMGGGVGGVLGRFSRGGQ